MGTASKPVTARGGIAHWIAVWFGCGHAPAAPGTTGSLAAVAIAAALAVFGGLAAWQIAALGVLLIAPGVWASGREEQACGKTDPNSVVVDEVAGQLIAFAGAANLGWPVFAAAFVLFRLFDIWKPFPIDSVQRLPRGWGIMADDVFAGIYAALVLYAAGCFNLY
ncbi:MAG: phosphatidylglycerophosphatase A [bacterium]